MFYLKNWKSETSYKPAVATNLLQVYDPSVLILATV